ncbi:MAG: DUF2927 domain-containing protein [Saprospiraceae bacterium]|nr:DUF2927 domain-containing protein [Saprospiraceae bacterium]
MVKEVPDSVLSNYYIYFGSGRDYARLFPVQANLIKSNFGLFRIYWNGQQLTWGHMYVDVFRVTTMEQLHLLREELSQSLGLPKDSYQFPGSIFQQSCATKTTDFMEIDKDLIPLLYHPRMLTNLNRSQVEHELEKILLAEK